LIFSEHGKTKDTKNAPCGAWAFKKISDDDQKIYSRKLYVFMNTGNTKDTKTHLAVMGLGKVNYQKNSKLWGDIRRKEISFL
jgi:hypothetical protein